MFSTTSRRCGKPLKTQKNSSRNTSASPSRQQRSGNRPRRSYEVHQAYGRGRWGQATGRTAAIHDRGRREGTGHGRGGLRPSRRGAGDISAQLLQPLLRAVHLGRVLQGLLRSLPLALRQRGRNAPLRVLRDQERRVPVGRQVRGELLVRLTGGRGGD